MEEKYFVTTIEDNDPDIKKYIWGQPRKHDIKTGCSWNELLHWCHRNINADYNNSFYPHRHWSDKPARLNEHHNLEGFFCNFRNNPHDGIYHRGYWKAAPLRYEYIQQKDEDGRLTHEWIKTQIFGDEVWVPPRFVPHRFQVIDSYGRIIPSGFIRSEYMKYVPAPEHDHKWTRIGFHQYGRHFLRDNHIFEFRKDPVPGINNRYQGGRWWHKYRGNHGHTIQELKAYHRDIIELKEVRKEYGVSFKIHRSWMDLDPWNHGHHRGTKGKGWKRSRKEKQWMKFGWKKVYDMRTQEDIYCPECSRKVSKKGWCDRCRKEMRPASTKRYL